MEYKNLKKSSFNFAFILQAKNVNGIATSARNFYFKTCSHYRWRFFKVKSPPPHYLICSLQLRVWVLDLFMLLLRSTLVGGFLLFAMTWVHLSCTFSSLFSGCFVVLTFDKFSSLSLSIGICGKCSPCQISKTMLPKSSSYFKLFHIPNTKWDSITLNCTKRLLQLLRAAPNNIILYSFPTMHQTFKWVEEWTRSSTISDKLVK